MYVYVSDKWNIIMKSSFRWPWMQNKYREYNVAYTMEDNIIFEWGKIIKYENSKQYIEDTDRYHLNKELEDTKKKNKELETIAKAKVKRDMELKREATERDKKVYLLKNMKWLQQS
jgi:hypothetical protein